MTTEPHDNLITPEDMKSALLRSGYLLEQRVRAALEQWGYYVHSSGAYPDEITGKSRELDISAITLRRAGPVDDDWAFAVILCECVNNSQPLVFFTYDEFDPTTRYLKYSGLPTQIASTPVDFERESLSDFLKLESYHHYWSGQLASQYCSFQKKRGPRGREEWMALHPDEHHDSIGAVMMALEADVKEHYQVWIPKFEVLAAHEEEESVNLQFYYPLLVLQGDIYTASFRDGHLILDEAQHVQLIRDHFSSNRQNSYQIDVVKESFLHDYLDLDDREMKSIGLRLQRNRRKVSDSMRLLMRRSTTGFDVEAIREALFWDFKR